MTHNEPPHVAPGSAPAGLVAAAVAAHEQIAPKTAAARTDFVGALLERFEVELGPHLVPFLAELAANENIPAPIRDLLGAMTEPQHFTQSLLIGLALGSVISPIIGTAVAPFVQVLANETWPTLPVRPLTPQEAAAGVLKGVIDEHDGAAIASVSGVDGATFLHMVDIVGNAIGIEQALLLLRRGQIDEHELARIVHYSNIRSDFLDDILKLKYGPVPIGEALAGAVQGHLAPDVAKRYVAEGGIDPENYEWLFETHGRPPGVVELGELVNRGEMPQATWEQAIRESDIKNKYIPALDKLRRRLMPERTVVSAIRQGVLPATEGITKLVQLGFNHADAATLAAEATATKHQANRDLAQATVLRLYAERLMPKAEAIAHLTALGYDVHEVNFLLELSDNARHERFQNAAISRVHAQYVNHRITASVASSALDRVGMESTGRDDLLKLWAQESAANVKVLSVSELQGGLRRGKLTDADFHERVVALGYDAADVPILRALAFPPSDFKGPPA